MRVRSSVALRLLANVRKMSNVLQYGFWALAIILQVVASIVMFRRGLHVKYVPFFAYLVIQAFRSVALFVILELGKSPALYKTYFVFYWTTEALVAVLCLLIILDLTRQFFREYRMVRAIVPAILMLGLLALLAFNVLLTTNSPGHESHRLISAILLLYRSLAVLQTGMVFVMFLLCRLMALPWRRDFSFGISLGLSVVGAIDIAAVSLRSQVGRIDNDFCAVTESFAYLLAVLIWLVYILAPRKETGVAANIMPETAIGNWNETLTDFLQE